MGDAVGLNDLPVEVIYRILDCLNIQTIFHSLYGVCHRINYILGTYNHYKFDFESISKHQFHLISRLIPQDRVVALILSDGYETPGQINLFLSSFNLKNFIRLSSLALYQIDDNLLRKVLRTISLKSLKCVSIVCRTEYHDETLALLKSSLIGHSLQKLTLASSSLCKILTKHTIANIKHLVLNGCMVRQIIKVLSSRTFIETLTLNNVEVDDDDDDLQDINSSSKAFKLVYLSFSSSSFTMNATINFLSWLISKSKQLQHLRVINDIDDEDYFDGSRWESLLSTTSLRHFQFHFHASLTMNQSINEILLLFRSPFWLNEKHWFVGFDKHRFLDQSFLYSIPWCDDKISWQPLMSFESENTLSDTHYSIFNEVKHLHIKLNCSVLESTSLPHHCFSSVNSLKIESETNQYMLFTPKITLSLNVILTQLVNLTLSVNINQRMLAIIFQETISLRHLTTHEYPVLDHIKSINNREMMSRIRSLALHEQFRGENDVIWLCEAFPQVEQLYVNVSSVRYMRTICSHLQFNLQTVYFLCPSIAHTKIQLEKTKVSLLNWLHQQQWNFTFHSENELIGIWLSSRQTKGWWEKKRRLSLPLNVQKTKKIKTKNFSTTENNQNDDDDHDRKYDCKNV